MTANGYLQIGLYLVALICSWPGHWGCIWRASTPDELPGYVRWLVRWKMGFIDWPVSSRTKACLAALCVGHPGVQPAGLAGGLRPAAAATLAAAEPAGLANVTPDLAFNTAVSFATNTNWQGYGGETP